MGLIRDFFCGSPLSSRLDQVVVAPFRFVATSCVVRFQRVFRTTWRSCTCPSVVAALTRPPKNCESSRLRNHSASLASATLLQQMLRSVVSLYARGSQTERRSNRLYTRRKRWRVGDFS